MRHHRLEREITAHHEAGHAVACLLRGEGTFRYISIRRNTKAGHLGIVGTRARLFDQGWVGFAGPWAESVFTFRRAGGAPFADLDGYRDDGDPFTSWAADHWDSEGCSLYDHLMFPLVSEQEGHAAMLEDLDPGLRRCVDVEDISNPGPGHLWLWHRLLSARWPAIEALALELLASRRRMLLDEALRVLAPFGIEPY